MVTKTIVYLAMDTFPLIVIIIESTFSLLPLGNYPLPLTTLGGDIFLKKFCFGLHLLLDKVHPCNHPTFRLGHYSLNSKKT